MVKKVEFEELVAKMTDTYHRKNADYGNSFEKSIDKRGLVASQVRMEDKFNRIDSLLDGRKPQVNDESLVDTYMDLANYAVMTAMYILNHRNESESE